MKVSWGPIVLCSRYRWLIILLTLRTYRCRAKYISQLRIIWLRTTRLPCLRIILLLLQSNPKLRELVSLLQREIQLKTLNSSKMSHRGCSTFKILEMISIGRFHFLYPYQRKREQYHQKEKIYWKMIRSLWLTRSQEAVSSTRDHATASRPFYYLMVILIEKSMISPIKSMKACRDITHHNHLLRLRLHRHNKQMVPAWKTCLLQKDNSLNFSQGLIIMVWRLL